MNWQIGNGRKLRVGEDPWVGSNQEHILREGVIRELRIRGIYYLYQLSTPLQEFHWEQTWIWATELGIPDRECRDLGGYLEAVEHAQINLRYQDDVIIWDGYQLGNTHLR